MIGLPLRGWSTLQYGFITQLPAADSWYGYTFTANMYTAMSIIVGIISLLLFFSPSPSLFLHPLLSLSPLSCRPYPSLHKATASQHLRCAPSTWVPSPRPSTGPSAPRRTLAPPGFQRLTPSTTSRSVNYIQSGLTPANLTLCSWWQNPSYFAKMLPLL